MFETLAVLLAVLLFMLPHLIRIINAISLFINRQHCREVEAKLKALEAERDGVSSASDEEVCDRVVQGIADRLTSLREKLPPARGNARHPDRWSVIEEEPHPVRKEVDDLLAMGWHYLDGGAHCAKRDSLKYLDGEIDALRKEHRKVATQIVKCEWARDAR